MLSLSLEMIPKLVKSHLYYEGIFLGRLKTPLFNLIICTEILLFEDWDSFSLYIFPLFLYYIDKGIKRFLSWK